jgi:hypothetical protein
VAPDAVNVAELPLQIVADAEMTSVGVGVIVTWIVLVRVQPNEFTPVTE